MMYCDSVYASFSRWHYDSDGEQSDGCRDEGCRGRVGEAAGVGHADGQDLDGGGHTNLYLQ